MDTERQKEFEEFDEQLRQAEELARKSGIPSPIETQIKVDALAELDKRLQLALRRLAESQKRRDDQKL